MHSLLFRKRVFDVIICLAMGAAVVSLVIFPSQSVGAAKDGLSLCANVIIPSLFPFFVLSNMIVDLGMTRYFGKVLEPVMRPLFNVNGECATAFVLGFVGGYPVGAKTVIALYENGTCTKAEAERLLSFCNNSGPAFILGVVGAGIFGSSKIGLLLYLAHTIASILIGILFRRWGKSSKGSSRNRISTAPKSFTAAFSGSIKSAFHSTLSICGFIVFFTVFIKLLFISGIIPAVANAIGTVFAPLGLNPEWAERLLTGLIEISSGVWTLKDAAGELTASIAMAAFMLGWAGLSIHSQVLSFIGGSGLSVRTYIYGKLLHGVLSAGIIFLLAHIFVFEAPAAAYLAEQVTKIASLDFISALTISLISCVCVIIIMLFCLSVWKRSRTVSLQKNNYGKKSDTDI